MNTLFLVFCVLMITSTTRAFLSKSLGFSRVLATRNMNTITTGVDFDTVAREWRVKWSPDEDKKSLASAQQTLNLFTDALKKVDGVKSVQRVVCGGCLDFKVVVALDAAKFGDWEAKKFAPEEEFLNSLKAIGGITQVETQTYTLMPVI